MEMTKFPPDVRVKTMEKDINNPPEKFPPEVELIIHRIVANVLIREAQEAASINRQ